MLKGFFITKYTMGHTCACGIVPGKKDIQTFVFHRALCPAVRFRGIVVKSFLFLLVWVRWFQGILLLTAGFFGFQGFL
jgi:hypothetical protein